MNKRILPIVLFLIGAFNVGLFGQPVINNIELTICETNCYDLTVHNTEINSDPSNVVIWYDEDPNNGGTILDPSCTDFFLINNTLWVEVNDGQTSSFATIPYTLIPDVVLDPIFGLDSACVGSTYFFSTQFSVPGYYFWTVPNGVNIIGGQGTETIEVQWDATIDGNVCVQLENECGLSTPTCLFVTQGTAPSMPTIGGTLYEACIYDIGHFETDMIEGMNYEWTVEGGGIISGQGTNAIEVDWLQGNFGGFGLVCLTVSNECGSEQSCTDIYLIEPAYIDNVSGATEVCPGETATYFANSFVNDIYFFDWTVPQGAVITSGNQTEVINVWWPDGVSGGEVCVTGFNSCGESPTMCTDVVVNPISQTFVDLNICTGDCIIINGSEYCQGGQYTEVFTSVNGCDSIVNFFINEIPILETFLNISLCQGACYNLAGTDYCEPGTYQETLVGASFFGCDSIVNLTLAYTDDVVPEIDAYIENGFGLDCNTTGTELVGFSSMPNSTFTWSGPGIDGINGDIIYADQAGTYTLVVTAPTGCTNQISIDVLAEYIDIDFELIPNDFDCSNSELTLEATFNTFLDPSTFYYSWQGPGITADNQSFANPTIDLPGTYILYVEAINGACNGTDTVEIGVADEVPMVLAVGNVSHCYDGGDIPPLSIAASSGYIVEWYDAPTGGEPVALGATYSPALTGTYYVELLDPNTLCRSQVRTPVTYELFLPDININYTYCEPGLQTYGLDFSTSEGIDSVATNFGTVVLIDVGIYNVQNIPAGESVVITVGYQSVNCYRDITNNDIPECDCSQSDISAAVIEGGDKVVCDGGEIPEICATVDNGETVDWYDADNDGTALATGTLCFTPTVAGTYYAETRNLSTACVADQRTSVTISIVSPPTYEQTVTCNSNLNSYSVNIITVPGAFLDVSVGDVTMQADGDFLIENIPTGVDLEGAIASWEVGCITSFSITSPTCDCPFIDPPVGQDLAFCYGDVVTLFASSNGLEIRWFNAEVDGDLLSLGETFIINEPGIYYAEAIDTENACVSERTAIVATVDQSPIVDAGEDQTINCFDGLSVTLGTIADPSNTYLWSGPNGFASTDAMPTVNAAGFYQLTVLNASGCEATDGVEVINIEPSFSLSTTDASCGNEDATAAISITGINNPIISWSNGASTNTLDNLAPGEYTVSVSTSNGTCDTTFVVMIQQDPACSVIISGYVYDDDENEDCDPATATPLSEYAVRILPLDVFVETDEMGYYEFTVDPGVYTLEVVPVEPFGMVCPAGIVGNSTVVALAYGDESANNNFFLKVNNNFDLGVQAFSGGAFPGQLQYFQFYYCNNGNESVSGQVQFTHDPSLSGFDMAAAGASDYDEATRTATWKFTDFETFECAYINFFMMVDPNGAGSVMYNHVEITPFAGDVNIFNNEYNWQQTILNNGVSNLTIGDEPLQTMTSEGGEVILNQNIPNPFSNRTIIPIRFAQAQKATLSIYDISGKILKVIERDFVRGYNEVVIDQSELSATGLLYYTLQTEQLTITKKMLILK